MQITESTIMFTYAESWEWAGEQLRLTDVGRHRLTLTLNVT